MNEKEFQRKTRMQKASRNSLGTVVGSWSRGGVRVEECMGDKEGEQFDLEGKDKELKDH